MGGLSCLSTRRTDGTHWRIHLISGLSLRPSARAQHGRRVGAQLPRYAVGHRHARWSTSSGTRLLPHLPAAHPAGQRLLPPLAGQWRQGPAAGPRLRPSLLLRPRAPPVVILLGAVQAPRRCASGAVRSAATCLKLCGRHQPAPLRAAPRKFCQDVVVPSDFITRRPKSASEALVWGATTSACGGLLPPALAAARAMHAPDIRRGPADTLKLSDMFRQQRSLNEQHDQERGCQQQRTRAGSAKGGGVGSQA